MKTADYIIIIIICILFAAALIKLIKDRRQGKGCCGACGQEYCKKCRNHKKQ